MSEADIDQMIDDAEEHRASDESRRALAEAKNQLDGLIYNTRRSFEEFGSNLSSSDGILVRDALSAADKAVDGSILDDVTAAHRTLSEAAQTLADAIYGSLGDSIGGDDDYDDDDFDDDFDDDCDDDDFDDDFDDDDDMEMEIEDDDFDD